MVEKTKENPYLIIIGLLVLLIVIYIFGNQFFSIEIALAIDTIIITIFIALTQQSQLNKLEVIGKQTKDTTEKLKTDSLIREIVNNFLGNINEEKNIGIEKNNPQKYKCFFPVEYNSRPLPFINQGDFYAIHVLSTYIGEDNLELIGITKHDKSINDDLLKTNAIFICAPTTNFALKNVLEYKEIKSDVDADNLRNWPLEGMKNPIPCWFVEDFRNQQYQWPIKKIKVHDQHIDDLLISPSEDIYISACALLPGRKFDCGSNIQRDYGLFARLNIDNSQYIIISGIHAQGTWIVASLLSNLLSGKKVDYEKTFLGSKEFIAVITGEFDSKKLAVNNESILVFNRYIWIKENNKWIRKGSDS